MATSKPSAEARSVAHADPRFAPADDHFMAVLFRLDTYPRAVTDWEADFLDSLLKQMGQGRNPSPKQRAVVLRMAQAYLSPEAAAEAAGQRRLL